MVSNFKMGCEWRVLPCEESGEQVIPPGPSQTHASIRSPELPDGDEQASAPNRGSISRPRGPYIFNMVMQACTLTSTCQRGKLFDGVRVGPARRRLSKPVRSERKQR